MTLGRVDPDPAPGDRLRSGAEQAATSTRNAVITGTNRGLGYGIAAALHQRGCVIHALNRTIRASEWQVERRCDLSDLKAVENVGSQLAAEVRPLSILVLNAGQRTLVPMEAVTLDQLEESFAVNALAPVVLLRALLAALDACNGHVFVVGSQAAEQPFEGGSPYCGSKGALRSLAQVADKEARPRGVRVTHLTLGAVRNRSTTNDEHKVSPASVGRAIWDVANWPRDMTCTELELRPGNPVSPVRTGIERLQEW